MPLSRDLKTGPRNHFIDLLAGDLGAFDRALGGELVGRSVLSDLDIAEIESRVSAFHARLDRISIDLEHLRPALMAHGADNDFMGRNAVEIERARVEARRALAEAAGAKEARS